MHKAQRFTALVALAAIFFFYCLQTLCVPSSSSLFFCCTLRNPEGGVSDPGREGRETPALPAISARGTCVRTYIHICPVGSSSLLPPLPPLRIPIFIMATTKKDDFYWLFGRFSCYPAPATRFFHATHTPSRIPVFVLAATRKDEAIFFFLVSVTQMIGTR